MNRLSEYLPVSERRIWERLFGGEKLLQEIRLRIQQPIMVYADNREYYLTETGFLTVKEAEGRVCTDEMLEEYLSSISESSLYAFQDEICQGFLTLPGGHRVGVVGQVVIENEKIKTVKHISSLNIRIAHEILGVSTLLIDRLNKKEKLENLLIVSPPGCGKTTLLRDCVRELSDGSSNRPGMRVGVVDERGEIAGCFRGKPQLHIGKRTDVLHGCPKKEGMLYLIRAMNPQVIAVDEIGGREDYHALEYAASCGVVILATMHGNCREDVLKHLDLESKEKSIFRDYVLLSRDDGKLLINYIQNLEEWNDQVCVCNSSGFESQRFWSGL